MEELRTACTNALTQYVTYFKLNGQLNNVDLLHLNLQHLQNITKQIETYYRKCRCDISWADALLKYDIWEFELQCDYECDYIAPENGCTPDEIDEIFNEYMLGIFIQEQSYDMHKNKIFNDYQKHVISLIHQL